MNSRALSLTPTQAMEFVDGEPLAELLKRRDTLTKGKIAEHVLPVTAGWTFAHNNESSRFAVIDPPSRTNSPPPDAASC